MIEFPRGRWRAAQGQEIAISNFLSCRASNDAM